MHKSFIALLLASTLSIGGCAAVAVTDQVLQESAAFALGVDTNKVTVSNKQKNGIKTAYTATVGKKSYQCYVTSTPALAGGVVSDAICSGGGKRTCDEVSRRAGRC